MGGLATYTCLPDEFQNTSAPSCAVPGVTMDPSQIFGPVFDTLQFIMPTAMYILRPTIQIQQTPVAASTEAVPDKVNTRLIAGVTVGSITIIVVALTVILGVVIIYTSSMEE